MDQEIKQLQEQIEQYTAKLSESEKKLAKLNKLYDLTKEIETYDEDDLQQINNVIETRQSKLKKDKINKFRADHPTLVCGKMKKYDGCYCFNERVRYFTSEEKAKEVLVNTPMCENSYWTCKSATLTDEEIELIVLN